MSNELSFHAFLAHNSKDKPQVRIIAGELKQYGLQVWLDEEQIIPGQIFQVEIQKAIRKVESAVIFIGQQGLGRWQTYELPTLYSQFVQAANIITVIPVLLPGVNAIPEDLLFLAQHHWVNFSNGIDDVKALESLVWGITGKKPDTIVKVIPQSQSDDLSYEPSKEIPNTQKRRNPEVIETQNTQQNQQDDSGDDLSSETGVNYIRLRDFLKAEQWKEADHETLAVMLKASGKEQQGWLDTESIENFPCTDLHTIDQLWVKYSNGQFGLSVQKRIWESVDKNYEKFGDRVGWRKGMFMNKEWRDYNKITFSTNAPEGHLPVNIITPKQVFFTHSFLVLCVSSLASRLVKCNI